METKAEIIYKTQCKTCTYKSPGFVCFSERDGSCLRDWQKIAKSDFKDSEKSKKEEAGEIHGTAK